MALEKLKQKLCPHCQEENIEEWEPLAEVEMNMGEIGKVNTYLDLSRVHITRKGIRHEATLYISMTAESEKGVEFFQLADSIKINYCPFCGRKLLKEG